MTDYRESICLAYLKAKQLIIEAGFGAEIVSSEQRQTCSISETDFLREAAWVILSVGMREAVIRRKFGVISSSFKGWESACSIAEDEQVCVQRALVHYSHVGKISAILFVCKYLSSVGYVNWRSRAFEKPIESFQEFPFIGAAAASHLAKNLGFNVAKSDRHMVRFASHLGFPSVEYMCAEIGRSVGDLVATVDSVLWRFATITDDYLDLFDQFQGLNS